MTKYSIKGIIIRLIENLCDKVQSTVLLNGSIGDRFRRTAGDPHRVFTFTNPFNTFLERIICEASDGQENSVRIGGRFAVDTVANEPDRLDTTTTR